MTPSVRAWIILALGVIGWDLAAPQGHTLSEQVDRWLDEHPVSTWVAGGIIFGHLLNITPPAADPIHLAFTGARRWHRGGQLTLSVQSAHSG